MWLPTTLNNMRFKNILTLLLWCAITSCATTPEDTDDIKDWTAEKFFQEARQALKGGDYETAIKYFEKLEARYPFGRYAQQAQLETAYAYYKYLETDSAIAAADRFIKLHPRHPRVDYAYYLRGLASFKVDDDFFSKMAGKDPSQLDPGGSRRSFNYFSELIRRFPNSKYVKDARKRMVYLRNMLAQHEVNVAKFYMSRGAHVAAANRAKYVIENYQRTPAITNAIAILARAYRQLGIKDLADDTLRVLEKNRPNDTRPD